MTDSALAPRQARGPEEAHPGSWPSPTRADRVNCVAAKPASFGPFRLFPAQRLLLEGGEPVRIGSRALDILIALVARAGELVRKQELMAHVWPDTFVEPANLTVHIAALRRALGDGRDGNRFLLNIPGRGYQFVAPVTRAENFGRFETATSAPTGEHHMLARLQSLV
jgi:DNA-binding winged helix-turn-helix (wHTH) protein